MYMYKYACGPFKHFGGSSLMFWYDGEADSNNHTLVGGTSFLVRSQMCIYILIGIWMLRHMGIFKNAFLFTL